jgi:hypothetical protein
MSVVVGAALALTARPARAHIMVDEPGNLEEREVGSVCTITWHILAPHDTLNWDLSYSVEGSLGPWITIADDVPVGDPSAQSVHTYDWIVPDVDAPFVFVRVIQDNDTWDDFSDYDDFPFFIVPACPWDLDDGGDVGVSDFLELLAEWGMTDVPADFDGGGVGVSDFLALLANWGPCP